MRLRQAPGNREDFVQMGIFTDYEELEKQKQENEAKMKKERALQEAILSVKRNLEKMPSSKA